MPERQQFENTIGIASSTINGLPNNNNTNMNNNNEVAVKVAVRVSELAGKK